MQMVKAYADNGVNLDHLANESYQTAFAEVFRKMRGSKQKQLEDALRHSRNRAKDNNVDSIALATSDEHGISSESFDRVRRERVGRVAQRTQNNIKIWA